MLALVMGVPSAPLSVAVEPEPEAGQARPQFAEMSEEPAYTPQHRDYAPNFSSTVRVPDEAEDPGVQPQTPLFVETGDASQPDLDVPAFMRRVQF